MYLYTLEEAESSLTPINFQLYLRLTASPGSISQHLCEMRPLGHWGV